MRRALTGQLEQLRGQIAKVVTLAEEARQWADRIPVTRWSAERVGQVMRDLQAVENDVGALHAELLKAGGGKAVALPEEKTGVTKVG